jgi:hypothetical protein
VYKTLLPPGVILLPPGVNPVAVKYIYYTIKEIILVIVSVGG